MCVKKIPVFIFVFITTAVMAQSPGFRFGPRVGMGSARFTGIAGMSDGFAAQLQLVASKQLTDEQQKLANVLSHQTILTEEDWEKFKTLFEKIYPGFFLKLNRLLIN